jgi:hypothetical protein
MGKILRGFVGLAGWVAVSTAGFAPLAANSMVELPGDDVGQVSAMAPPQPVQLLAFDYRDFFERATELGLPSQTLGYTLAVAADGQVTDCTLARRFRRAFIRDQVCKALVGNAQFEPARDAQGNAIAAAYQSEIRIYSFFAPNR